MNTTKVKDLLKAAKALVAFIGAVLTAASGIWIDNKYITFGLAVVTGLTVFYTKNAKTIEGLITDLGKLAPKKDVVVVIDTKTLDDISKGIQ